MECTHFIFEISLKPFSKFESNLKKKPFIVKHKYSNEGFYEIFKFFLYLYFFFSTPFYLLWSASLLFWWLETIKTKQVEMDLDEIVLLTDISFPPAPKCEKKTGSRHQSQTLFQRLDSSVQGANFNTLFQRFDTSVQPT